MKTTKEYNEKSNKALQVLQHFREGLSTVVSDRTDPRHHGDDCLFHWLRNRPLVDASRGSYLFFTYQCPCYGFSMILAIPDTKFVSFMEKKLSKCSTSYIYIVGKHPLA